MSAATAANKSAQATELVIFTARCEARAVLYATCEFDLREAVDVPLVAEAKSRKNGSGFTTLERWLGEYDLLVLRRNHSEPVIVLTWWIWARVLERVRR
jgi:hypothetical protein